MTVKTEIQNLIEQLTNDSILLSKALMKAKSINSKIKNQELSKFISGEMDEEYDDDTLPEYRLVFGNSTFEFKNAYTGVTDIRSIPIPEATHFNGKSTNYRPIMFSVIEIEQAVNGTDKDETFKILFTPGQFTLAQRHFSEMLQQNNGWQLTRAWWSHSPTSFPAILFKAKQKLIDILLDIENSIIEKDFEEKIYYEKSQFDASFEILKIIEKAKNKIILIDGYVDGTTLKLLSSKKEYVKIELITDPKSLSDSFEVLIDKFNKQYKNLEIKTSKAFHDRFLVIDDLNYYQIGASLKDLGNKTFSFVRLKETFITEALKNKIDKELNK